MAKYEVIAPGVFVKDGSAIKELAVGSIIDYTNEYVGAKVKEVSSKSFEVATPEEPEKQLNKSKTQKPA